VLPVASRRVRCAPNCVFTYLREACVRARRVVIARNRVETARSGSGLWVATGCANSRYTRPHARTLAAGVRATHARAPACAAARQRPSADGGGRGCLEETPLRCVAAEADDSPRPDTEGRVDRHGRPQCGAMLARRVPRSCRPETMEPSRRRAAHAQCALLMTLAATRWRWSGASAPLYPARPRSRGSPRTHAMQRNACAQRSTFRPSGHHAGSHQGGERRTRNVRCAHGGSGSSAWATTARSGLIPVRDDAVLLARDYNFGRGTVSAARGDAVQLPTLGGCFKK
jgi:hypothetical protein